MLKSVLVFTLFVGISNALTAAEYEKARSYIIDSIRNMAPTLIHPTYVRLSFHDCVSYCDGCINLDNPDNAGLAPAIAALELVYGNLTQVEHISISRADLWAIAGRVGAEWGMEGMPGNINFVPGTQLSAFNSPFPAFEYGRVDCPTAPSTSTVYTFPSPHMTHSELFDYFSSMDLSTTQTVALLGAHTLGKCSATNSGYRGPWVTGKGTSSFDNVYYKEMIDPANTYTGVNAAGGKATGSSARPQYTCTTSTGANCGIMLNTDFEVYYDMTLNSKSFLATCKASAGSLTCPKAATYDTAAKYASDNAAWLADYVDAYDAMTAFVDPAAVTLQVVA